ncbi:MAG: Rossmann fold nucleotide-binding protein Smf possibly involved in DNA uptake [uncultured Solirubrobacteraceae bacterium]|uniref:Rossmann fold nucleotide-binding protein Smf possibly involved in DNA uptake n=1 Tax=uncultured Solirubrobacteraceae bacterium TaxID=1162706 RepID=A0A6J4RRJ1_9ACTN|nr:MAG: Rossmann fold nucleotide-binding protein Smf possibly involved in DNA uptake [uncultured Solirubrobacteraceae bacterium]
MTACDACLRRTALIAQLAPHVERGRRDRRKLSEMLSLPDERLIDALAGDRRGAIVRAHATFDPGGARERLVEASMRAVCRHDASYPPRMLEADDAPAVLHVAGDVARLAILTDRDVPAVAVVGARRAGADGLSVARALGRGLAAAGVTVISGMALGIDAAAHAGALEVGGPTITVLAGGADVAYPASKRSLHRELVRSQAAISEMPPGFKPYRWCFPARNRTIAGLASMTIVVEAAERSGSLITADLAQELGRAVGAVPGPVTASRCAGTNALLRDGAFVIRDAQDALDEALGIGVATALTGRRPEDLGAALRSLLQRVEDGRDTVSSLAATPSEAQHALAGLAELELLGFVRRGPGGHYVRLL